MNMRRYRQQSTSKNILPLKTSHIFRSPHPIIFCTGAAVAVAAPALWVGLPHCGLSVTMWRRCCFSRWTLPPRDLSTNTTVCSFVHRSTTDNAAECDKDNSRLPRWTCWNVAAFDTSQDQMSDCAELPAKHQLCKYTVIPHTHSHTHMCYNTQNNTLPVSSYYTPPP